MIARMWITAASMLLVVHTERLQADDPGLDKTGTSEQAKQSDLQETPQNQGETKPCSFQAEGVGFEPTNGTGPSPVFKTGAFNRSAIPPTLLFKPLSSIRPALHFSLYYPLHYR